MGRDWDNELPSVDIWQECLRVLKPGAFAFIVCTPRQNELSEMIRRLSDAGFNTNFTSLYWMYSSGFPKAANISKLIDKKKGAEREVVGYNKLNPNDKKVYYPNSDDAGWVSGTHDVSQGARQQITTPATPEAKHFDGWFSFSPKPAVEIVIVAQKPFNKGDTKKQKLDFEQIKEIKKIVLGKQK